MDAGSFVIALLTAAGAAAGPAALGAPPDDTAATARCIAAPEEELSGSARSGDDVGQRSRPDADTGSPALTREQLEEIIDIFGPESDRDTGQESRTGSAALAEELAQELADIVAESDDPTSQRLAAALADAGFEPSATGGSRQETAASRSDDEGRGDRSSRSDERGGDQRGDQRGSLDDQLGQRDEQADDRRGDNRQRDDRSGRNQDDASACDEQVADTGANRSSDLEDVLARRSDRDQGDSDRSGSRAERDADSGIAAALERGERTAE
jgi:hypothetical protein